MPGLSEEKDTLGQGLKLGFRFGPVDSAKPVEQNGQQNGTNPRVSLKAFSTSTPENQPPRITVVGTTNPNGQAPGMELQKGKRTGGGMPSVAAVYGGSSGDDQAFNDLGEYYPFLNHKWHTPYVCTAKNEESGQITKEEFNALAIYLKKTCDAYKGEENPLKINDGKVLNNYKKVYRNAEFFPEDNSILFKIDKQTCFTVALEQKQGFELKFSNDPKPQAIAAAAGVIHDALDIFKTKQKKVKVTGLIIKEYDDNPIAGLSIFCSLMGQNLPVEFQGFKESFKDEPPGAKKLAELFSTLQEDKENKRLLMHLVEDDHVKIKHMINWMNAHPEATKDDLFEKLNSIINHSPDPNQSFDRHDGTSTPRGNPPITPRYNSNNDPPLEAIVSPERTPRGEPGNNINRSPNP